MAAYTDENNYHVCRMGLIYGNNCGGFTDEQEESAREWLARVVHKAERYDMIREYP